MTRGTLIALITGIVSPALSALVSFWVAQKKTNVELKKFKLELESKYRSKIVDEKIDVYKRINTALGKVVHAAIQLSAVKEDRNRKGQWRKALDAAVAELSITVLGSAHVCDKRIPRAHGKLFSILEEIHKTVEAGGEEEKFFDSLADCLKQLTDIMRHDIGMPFFEETSLQEFLSSVRHIK